MAIEVELKARVREAAAVRAALDALAHGEAAAYADRYFESADGELAASGQELRLRTITTDADTTHLLTYKRPPEEIETLVADAGAVDAILRGLGYREFIAFTKHCRNYRLRRGGRDVLATLVIVPELDGTFLEVESIAARDAETGGALAAVRAVLADMGIPEADLTAELYTEAVARARALRG